MTTLGTDRDLREHVTAVRAVLDARFAFDPAFQAKAYTYSDVPGSAADSGDDAQAGDLPPIYCIVHIERSNNPGQRLSEEAGAGLWRLTVTHLGTTTGEALGLYALVTDALEDVALTIGGRETTPLEFDLDRPPRPDDGHYVGSSEWTYGT